MTSKNLTPDAVRAAIAEHLQGKHPDMHFDYESGEQWSVRVFHPDSWNHITFTIYGTYFDIGYLRSLGEAIVSATNAQIGALRPVGEGDQWCLPISTLRNWLDWAESVGPMCGYGLHTLIHREVIAADAAAHAGDALRPVGEEGSEA